PTLPGRTDTARCGAPGDGRFSPAARSGFAQRAAGCTMATFARLAREHAPVAQGIEHRSPKAGVTGPNPVGGATHRSIERAAATGPPAPPGRLTPCSRRGTDRSDRAGTGPSR